MTSTYNAQHFKSWISGHIWTNNQSVMYFQHDDFDTHESKKSTVDRETNGWSSYIL